MLVLLCGHCQKHWTTLFPSNNTCVVEFFSCPKDLDLYKAENGYITLQPHWLCQCPCLSHAGEWHTGHRLQTWSHSTPPPSDCWLCFGKDSLACSQTSSAQGHAAVCHSACCAGLFWCWEQHGHQTSRFNSLKWNRKIHYFYGRIRSLTEICVILQKELLRRLFI